MSPDQPLRRKHFRGFPPPPSTCPRPHALRPEASPTQKAAEPGFRSDGLRMVLVLVYRSREAISPAARLPAPMAEMTVAAPVTISPPANTLGMEVSPVSGSARM